MPALFRSIPLTSLMMVLLCTATTPASAAGTDQATAARAAAPDARVRVTGQRVDINGQTQIPRGMFGVHAFRTDATRIREWGIEMRRNIHASPNAMPTTFQRRPEHQGLSMIIDCLGDRYHPATVLTDRNYERFYTDLGQRYGEAVRSHEHYNVVEFWNEPFLNWASKPGVNYDPKFYDQSEAEEGKPMRIRGWEQPLEHLVWSRQVRTVHAQSGHTDIQAYLAHAYIGLNKDAGETFEFRGRQYRNVEMWWGRDPTQKSWYSGRQNQQFYDWMLIPFARALKQTNPRATLIAGWDFNINLNNWDMWHSLYKPTIDNAIAYLDGITEHHYYVPAERISMWYETVVAYTVSEHGKFVKMYNTEAGGFADSQLPGNEHLADMDQRDPLRNAVRVLTYNLRDTLNLLHLCPDKAASRAKHGEPDSRIAMSGEEAMFRLLKPLRGELVDAHSDDHRIWPIVSINDGQLVVVVFNDHGRAMRDVALAIAAPAGQTLGPGTRTWVTVDGQNQTLRLDEQAVPASGGRVELRSQVPAQSAVRYVFPLRGEAADQPVLQRRQFFAKGILHEVSADGELALTIKVDPALRKRATAARLRLVLENHRGGNLALKLNGQRIAVPARNMVVDVPVDLTRVHDVNELHFAVVGEHGYRVCAASLMIDAPRP